LKKKRPALATSNTIDKKNPFTSVIILLLSVNLLKSVKVAVKIKSGNRKNFRLFLMTPQMTRAKNNKIKFN